MASIVKTTAISLRKGNTEANKSFTGIKGELVVDLGEDDTGTDLNTTLRLHNGVIAGGIPMARADLLNISTSQLAENRDTLGMPDEKNLAYADLSNMIPSENANIQANIANILNDYGLAKTSDVTAGLDQKANVDMSNINTEDLATGEGVEGKHAGKDLAYADGSNLNTTALEDRLAKVDTSNINTKDLTDDTIHTGADGNKPLAYADLSNVSGQAFNTALFDTHASVLNIEQTTNKIESYFDDNGNLKPELSHTQYPDVLAVKEYTDTAIENGNFMETDISNATSFDVLYSNAQQVVSAENIATIPNNTSPYKYIIDTTRDVDHDPSEHEGYDLSGILKQGTNFVEGKLYCTYQDVSLVTGSQQNYHQKDSLKVLIEAVDGDGIPTTISIWQNCGVNALTSGTNSIRDNDDKEVTFTLSSATDTAHTGYYTYNISNISTGTATSMTFNEGDIVNLTTPVLVDQVLWVNVEKVSQNDGAILKCSFYPEFSKHHVDLNEFSYTYIDPETHEEITVDNAIAINNGGEDGVIDFKCWAYLPQIGGAGLAKTDLSNLLGMTQEEADKAKGTPWKLIHNDTIPSLSTTIDTAEYYNITNKGDVWDAIKAAYNYTMGDAAASGNVAAYVKTTLDQYALSDTYRGQVNLYVATENDLPTTGLSNGYKVMVANYNNTGVPHVYTYNGSAWTHEAFINPSSQQANGDYVYCLDLGSAYYNVPGNITWNHTTQALDIAPDAYNAPDNITIVKDQSTGKLKINEFYVPAPEFFNGNGSTTIFTLNANNCPNGKVPFDVYVDGVFQYPTISYTFNASNRQITFANGFAPQTGTKNIAVIYRGIIFGTGNNAGPINGKHS